MKIFHFQVVFQYVYSLNFWLLFIILIGYEKIAKLLIQKGANVNAVDENNNSPLLWAAFAGTTSIAYIQFISKACFKLVISI